MGLSITLIIVVLTVLISLQGFKSNSFINKTAFSPFLVKHQGEHLRIVSHIFVHADWAHLLFNMISFYLFGELMEAQLYSKYGFLLGNVHFSVIYFVGGLAATVIPFIRNRDNGNYLSLGASGAVSSIIFAAILWNPTMELGLFIIPGLFIPAYIFGPLYLAFEFYAFRRGKTNIAHDAHIGGAIFGVIYILFINIDKGKELMDLIFQK
jgi:membrane associated rhomboid family serine protease